MAIYRQLHTTFWKDKRVGEWSQDQKLFFLYLLTNDYTTQCGVYEFNKRYAKFELDMSSEQIDTLLDFLVSEGRIVYNEKTEELMVVNWLKYNNARSPKVSAVIDKELKEIKTLEFELEVIRKCLELGYPIKTKEPKKDTVSIPYPYSINTISQPTPTHNQHITNTEAAEEKSAPAPADGENMFQAYQKFFGHAFSPIHAEDMQKWADEISEPLVIEAMRRSALNTRDYSYSTGIMKNWAKKGIKTLEGVAEDDNRFSAKVDSGQRKTANQREMERREAEIDRQYGDLPF